MRKIKKHLTVSKINMHISKKKMATLKRKIFIKIIVKWYIFEAIIGDYRILLIINTTSTCLVDRHRNQIPCTCCPLATDE